MNGKAFIRMMREDIETHKDKNVLSGVVDVMEYVVNMHPDCEIDASKNVEDCYKAIFEAAKKNASADGKYCCSTPSMSIEAVGKYLGIKVTGDGETANAVVKSSPVGGGAIALEDFL